MTTPPPTGLLTRWGAALDPDDPLPEYPRPQLARDSHLSLNGRWQYAITPPGHPGAGDRAEPGAEPGEYDGEIIVPFSPEAPLSGVGRTLLPGHTLWYRRTLTLPDGFRARPDDRVLLHFGAVDQTCRVHLNGTLAGRHTGGYLPFTLDITDTLRPGPNTLTVAVQDGTDTNDHARGKQRLDRGGIWYTPQSGIWQTVWAESVPAARITALTLTPHLGDDPAIEITAHTTGTPTGAPHTPVRLTVHTGGQPIAHADAAPGRPVRIPLPGARTWTPEDPHLYDLTADYGTDHVRSYFGMRTFATGPDRDGVPRLLLNGRPYFHAGVLDQGYWPDGLYTAPSDQAMIHDIATMKRLGFTMLRKHIKIEPLRWYHHCDRLGILVWQDMVNGGAPYNPLVITAPVATPLRLDDRRHRRFGRADPAGRARFRTETRRTVEHLRNTVSIAVWVPFNEGWGQFDAADITAAIAALDPTRTIDHASGWHDQRAGDLRSLHVYFRRFRVPRRPDPRVLVLSEYGGYNHRVHGHTFNDKDFGYQRHATPERLAAAYTRLHAQQIIPAVPRGLSATVYTQLSDVEDELNGLLTYDREILKLPADLVRALNDRLRLDTPETGPHQR
ncbi:sugar-binding domain-containing protein [Spirillospora sp. NPDC029432]|uniref:glycoside hydrolase family 2 protein n=1 Tax=Spirillospora sp. NPDC029432 TaxID=3154599 RepID=UPI003454F7F4